MKARIAIVSVSSLISLAMVVAFIGCLEMGSTPERTPTPTRVPTSTPTPKPTATPYVSGPRPVYDVETKTWRVPNLMEREATRVAMGETQIRTGGFPTPKPMTGKTYVKTLNVLKPAATPVPPTPTITPTPIPTPIPDRYPVSDENARIKEFMDGFEPLTPENLSIAFRIASPYGSSDIELPNGDVLYLTKEVVWVEIGYTHHFIASFLYRCLDGVEHPQVRDQLEIRQRHDSWDRLEFVRDASAFDYGLMAVRFGERDSFAIESVYRIGEDAWLLSVANIGIETCEMGRFGFTELVKNTHGYLVNPKGSPSPYCGVRLDDPDEYEICPEIGHDEFKRSEMLDPITNSEIETGQIRCRGTDCD